MNSGASPIDPADAEPDIVGRMHLQVTWRCNYRCSYCFQNGRRENRPKLAAVSVWDDAFTRLSGRWKVLITGGEPLLVPELPAVARVIAKRGHLINLITNLAFGSERIEPFIEATGPALKVISASWHPEHTSLGSFIERAEEVRRRLAPGATLVASFTLTEATLDQLPLLARVSEQHGIQFLVRNARQDGHANHELIETAIRKAETPWLLFRRTRAWAGSTCSAGVDYFVVDCDGSVYRCFADLDAGLPPIGNFFEGTYRLASAGRCPHHVDCCMCGKQFPARSAVPERVEPSRLRLPLAEVISSVS